MEVEWEDAKMNNSGIISPFIYEGGPHGAISHQSFKPTIPHKLTARGMQNM